MGVTGSCFLAPLSSHAAAVSVASAKAAPCSKIPLLQVWVQRGGRWQGCGVTGQRGAFGEGLASGQAVIICGTSPVEDFLQTASRCSFASRCSRWALKAVLVLQEIDACCEALRAEAVALDPSLGPLLVLPLHPGVGRDVQKVYEASEQPGRGWVGRKVIVTHWLADSAFMVDTVRHIVDTGLELRNVSHWEQVSFNRGLESLGSNACP